jgi:hypothetical protein
MPKVKQYEQKFRKEWLHDDTMKDRVIAVPGDATKAHCKYCKCYVKAKLQDLKLHADTKKHKSALLSEMLYH